MRVPRRGALNPPPPTDCVAAARCRAPQVPEGTLSVSVHDGINVEVLKRRMAALVADRYGVQRAPERFGAGEPSGE
eukprot:1622569-Prymnesium_polylepis.1